MKLTALQNKLVRWLQKATTDDIRTYLRHIRVGPKGESWVATTDGFRIHAVPKSSLPQMENDRSILFHAPIRVATKEVNFNPVEDTFPNLEQATSPRGEPTLDIGINAKFLADALAGIDGLAHFRFYDSFAPFHIFGQTNVKGNTAPVHIVLMPMDLGQAPEQPWKLTNRDSTEEDSNDG